MSARSGRGLPAAAGQLDGCGGRAGKPEEAPIPRDSITIAKNRTDQAYEIPISKETVRVMDFRQIKTDPEDSGIVDQATGFKPGTVTIMFAFPRTVGWPYRGEELIKNPEKKISRPHRDCTGIWLRDVRPIEQRRAS